MRSRVRLLLGRVTFDRVAAAVVVLAAVIVLVALWLTAPIAIVPATLALGAGAITQAWTQAAARRRDREEHLKDLLRDYRHQLDVLRRRIDTLEAAPPRRGTW